MEMVLRSRNIELPDPMRDYIQKKLDRVEIHLANSGEAKVEISKEETRSPHDKYLVQITVSSNGILLKAEEHESDMRAAIDAATHVIDSQVRRYKAKHYTKKRRLIKHGVETLPDEAGQEEDRPAKVVKLKRYNIQPMTVEQATERMELLGHDFFFFFNADSDGFAVVYKRNDGDYGLIEPEST
ncbi:ribosome hibernation-promoting factor, HPF/YfiA family [Chloroflexota bacterium]